MSCQTECSIDIAAMRSIWEDNKSSTGKSPSISNNKPLTIPSAAATMNNSTSSSSSTMSVGSNKNSNFNGLLMAGSNGKYCPSSYGPIGTPSMRRASLASYDTGNGAFTNTFPTQTGYFVNQTQPKRASMSSLWDYPPGSSSGQQSPNSYSSSFNDYPSDHFSPASRHLQALYDEQLNQRSRDNDNEKIDVDILYKLFGSLLMMRDQTLMSTLDAVKEAISSNRSPRRSSMASSSSQYFERDRSMSHRGSLHDDHLSSSSFPSNSSNFGHQSAGQTNYESALERIEREAKMRRTSAYQSDTNFTWKGTLTTRFHESPTYATKVFVGGLPYDVTPEGLTDLFGKFGLSNVQFPPRGRGHAYLVFESESQVQALLNSCENKGPGQFFFWVSSRRGKDRHAQVIPWATEDSDWLASSESETSSTSGNESSDSSDFEMINAKLDGSAAHLKKHLDQTNTYKHNTVFVGALHGEITAEGLQKILSELFGPVIHVGIDTDKNRYPNGSARVTFANRESFHRAVLAEFVQVVTPRFSKTIQLDAYIEDGSCSLCAASTPVFCRHPKCFRYYCPMCFENHRNNNQEYHPPVMRNRNNGFNNSSVSGSRLPKERGSTLQ